jgi:hypothetical protein
MLLARAEPQVRNLISPRGCHHDLRGAVHPPWSLRPGSLHAHVRCAAGEGTSLAPPCIASRSRRPLPVGNNAGARAAGHSPGDAMVAAPSSLARWLHLGPARGIFPTRPTSFAYAQTGTSEYILLRDGREPCHRRQPTRAISVTSFITTWHATTCPGDRSVGDSSSSRSVQLTAMHTYEFISSEFGRYVCRRRPNRLLIYERAWLAVACHGWSTNVPTYGLMLLIYKRACLFQSSLFILFMSSRPGLVHVVSVIIVYRSAKCLPADVAISVFKMINYLRLLSSCRTNQQPRFYQKNRRSRTITYLIQ